jgi:hypothetical protein
MVVKGIHSCLEIRHSTVGSESVKDLKQGNCETIVGNTTVKKSLQFSLKVSPRLRF